MEQEEKITSPVEAGTDSTPVEAAPEAAPAKGHHHEGGRKGQGGRRTERRAPADKLYEERVSKLDVFARPQKVAVICVSLP